MDWNAALYRKSHGFVAEYGKNLLACVPEDAAQCILDFGCGTGELTAAMIRAARETYPGPEYHVLDAAGLAAQGWTARFDLVFSNAVFHWIQDQETLLRALHAVLKPDGLLVCEFGAQGNVAAVCAAFASALATRGRTRADPFYFPTPAAYRQKLETAGFQVRYIEDYDRPTPLSGGENGLALWLEQFFAEDLAGFEHTEQMNIFREVACALRPRLWDGERWIADYRRLRLLAVRN